MSSIRVLLILALVAAPCWLSSRYSEHHEGENIFLTLYMHLIPAKLVVEAEGHGDHASGDAGHADASHNTSVRDPHDSHGAGHYLFAFTVPGAPAFFDMDPAHEGTQLVATNMQLFQVAAVLLVLVCFSGVPRYLRTGQGDYVSRLFAGFAGWVRDDMVYAVMGKELGAKFLPYFLSLFFFLLFMNVMGLVPHAATATASIFVTGAMAIVTLFSMIGGGMVAQGPIAFWKHLVPHVPAALWPLMFVVELIGLLVKPFALMIRLFANMSGGHMVVLSFLGLIFFFANMSPVVGYAASPVAVGFAVFIMIIESFVALLQAYIFTMLSIIFVNASIHPEH
ncbi:MAG: F0F1 ATP synthase subunit A [Planctomycetota bacterium]